MPKTTDIPAAESAPGLGSEAGHITEAAWKIANARRGVLIDREYTEGLTVLEEVELEALQSLADRYIAQEGIYRLEPNPLIEQLKARGLWDRRDEADDQRRHKLAERIADVLFPPHPLQQGIRVSLVGDGVYWNWGTAHEAIRQAIVDYEFGNEPREPQNK